MADSFVQTPDPKRATKKSTALDKFNRNGKYTGKGLRAKQNITNPHPQSLLQPRETVVQTVLNRDCNQSIALPPSLDKDPKLNVKIIKKKPALNTEDL